MSIRDQLVAAAGGAANMDGIINEAVDVVVAMEARLMRHGDWSKAKDLVIAAVREAAIQAGVTEPVTVVEVATPAPASEPAAPAVEVAPAPPAAPPAESPPTETPPAS